MENREYLNIDKYDLFIFDFDGTIMDTENIHYLCWKEIIQKYSDEELSQKEYIEYFHSLQKSDKLHLLKIKFGIEEKYDILYEEKCKLYYNKIHNNPISFISGFEKLLSYLIHKNKKYVIVTNTSEKNLNFFLHKHPILKDNATKIYTKENFYMKKPHPDCYLKIVNDFPNHKMIGFEDSYYGFHCLYQVPNITPVYVYHSNYYYNQYICNHYKNIIVSHHFDLITLNDSIHKYHLISKEEKKCEYNSIQNILNNNIQELEKNKKNMIHTIHQISILLKNKEQNSHIYLTGMGKSGYICKKSASTWQSLSIPCTYIDLPNLPHGDFGLLKDNDTIIFISNSGNTEEIIYILKYIKNNLKKKITTISIVANSPCEIEKYSNYTFILNPIVEADYINMTPSTSSILFMALLDAIAIHLKEYITKEEFQLYHPSGSLGKK